MEQILAASSILLWVGLLFNLLLTLALVKRITSKSMLSFLKIGTKAPDFTAQTLDGKPVTMVDYAGRNIVLLFTTTWCGHCKKKFPDWQELFPKAKRAGYEFLLVVTSGSLTDVQAMIDEYKLSIPILHAPNDTNSFMKDYKVEGTPSCYIVGSDGKVVFAGYPGTEDERWRKWVNEWEGEPKAVKQLSPAGVD